MNLKQFGEELRALRKEAHWSQEELIEALDQLAHAGPPVELRVIDATLLSRWEHARTQNGRQWKPTRAYVVYLIRLFAPSLGLTRAQQWAAQAGYQISTGELQAWFASPIAQQERAKHQATGGDRGDASSLSPIVLAHNLPALLTTFVGREAEIARVIAYLATPSTRLVTLVGEGGVGKTRLALEVAQAFVHEPSGSFGDGIYFIPLVGVSTMSALVSLFAETLGITLAASDDPEQQLLSQLHNRHYLLVLDNFEQLVAAAAPLITSVLQAAPGTRLLITSRMRLNLAEEWVVALTGLAFPAMTIAPGPSNPDLSPFPVATMSEEYAAVKLFLARARQIDAHFGHEIDPEQGAAIVRVCGLLQGIPLGIEMAAAWVHMLSCREIADQIGQNLDFLTLPHRNAPERHRSMRAIFEHSWRLLSAQEQAVLAALAVFHGNFTYEAAVNVTAASLLTLRSLVDKSLLTHRAGRYELHELLRHFAEEQLSLEGDKLRATATRHSAYYLRFLAAREARLAGQEAHETANEITSEFNNIRQAWRWAATCLALDEIDRSLYALWRYYLLNGYSSDGEQLVRLVIDQIKSTTTSVTEQEFVRALLSKLLTMRAAFLYRQGYGQQSLRLSEEAIVIAESCMAEKGTEYQFLVLKAFALWQMAVALVEVGELEKAQVLLEESLHLINEPGGDVPRDVHSRTMASELEWQLRMLLAYVFLDASNYPLARETIGHALAICQRSGEVRGQLTCLGNLGWIELQAGNYDAARQAYEQALPLSSSFGYRLEEAANLIELGNTIRLQGEVGLAMRYLERGWVLARDISAHKYANYAVEALVTLYGYLGAYQQAQAWLNRWHPTDKDTHGTQTLLVALLAYLQGMDRQAMDSAWQGWGSVNKAGSATDKAKALVLIGHIRATLQQWEEATDAYRQAITLYTAMARPALAVVAQAGLADVGLKMGDLEAARQEVEAILPVLAEARHVGIDEPFSTYFACYRLLHAVGDERAAPLLERAYRLLHRYADHIGDPTLVHSFWEKVAPHRELAAAYVQAHPLSNGAAQQE